MKRLKNYINNREFAKFFLMFFTGTLLAQIFTLAISPLLTRIYTPADFGVYGVYTSVIAVLIVFVTGRYEFAMNSAKEEEDAISVYKIVNYFSVFSSGFIFIVLLLLGDSIIETFNLEISKSLLYFIPFTLLILGYLQSSTYFLNRHKNFAVLSKSKIYLSLTNGSVSISAGLLGFGVVGLIMANIIAVFISQLYQRIKGIRKKIFKPESSKIKYNLKKYKQYPLYNAPSAFFDNLALQAPVFILLLFFSEAIVGFYSLTVRVIGMPLGLIGTSISQVFLSQVSERHRNNQSYRGIIIKTSKYLALVGLVPLIIVLFFGPSLFAWFFGEKWHVAGEFTRILIFGYYFKFVVSPLSMVFFINQQVKLLSIIQTTRAFTTAIVLLVCASNFSVSTVLTAFTIHEVIFYLIYYYYILKTSK